MPGLFKEIEIEEKLAKSDGLTIREHNEGLFQRLETLKERVVIDNTIETYLKNAIKYHDYGKSNSEFQNKITGINGNEILFHHIISPLFYLISKGEEKLTEDDVIIVNAILRHHSRQLELIESVRLDYLNNNLKNNLHRVFDSIREYFVDNINFEKYVNNYLNIIIHSNNYKPTNKSYILTTGLLIRLDHAASGDLDVEEEPIKEDRKELLLSYLKKEGKSTQLRPFQQIFGIDNKSNYQCIVADTGLGKTGLSVLWSQRKKFYILPNRASVNAMYNTLKKIYGEDKVGLLHSTSLYNLLEEDDDISVLKQYDQTRVLSKPVTVCTADQLFTAAFNMPGYEKIYATLSYSDVVIDEIQGFQPQQIIPILKQIRETKELGTRYLIITATLPDIVAKKLCEYGFCLIENDLDTIDSIKRHKIKIEEKQIDELIDEMINKCKENKKVLVVTNTVGKAQKVYQSIKEKIKNEQKKIDVNILHSRFIWKDRQDKEKAILKVCEQDENGDYKNKNGCIWVCTQIVEASLDIDFDYLFTEASTADSLIQRMGRVWRHRKSNYTGDKNIIIAKNVEYKVYEKILVEKSIEMIKRGLDDECFLNSKEKREIVKELYKEENLKQWNSGYLTDWKNFETQINSGWNFILEENAQKAFRDVMTIELIPACYKERIECFLKLLENVYEKINNDNNLTDREKKQQKRIKRTKILKKIQEYKVPVPIFLVNPKVSQRFITTKEPIEWIDKTYNIGILNEKYEYSPDLGLTGKSLEIQENYNYGNII